MKNLKMYIVTILIGALLYICCLLSKPDDAVMYTVIYFISMFGLYFVIWLMSYDKKLTKRKIAEQIEYNKSIEGKWNNLEQTELKNLSSNNDVEKYSKALTELAKDNKNRTKYRVILLIGIIVSTLAIIIFKSYELIFVLLFCFLYYVHEYRYIYVSRYRDDYANKVIKPLLKNRGLNYSRKGMTVSNYMYGDFEKFDAYYSYDEITGMFDNIPFQISNVTTQKQLKDGEPFYKTLFDGTVALVKMEENINTTIDIIPQKIKKEENFIPIDNDEFEKIFDIYSLDEIKTIRLLTPDVIMKILDLKSLINIEFEIKIVNNSLFIRFYDSHLFELNEDNPDKDAKKITTYLDIIEKIRKLTEAMTKEIKNIVD